MNRDEIIKKNLDLHAEWKQYVFKNPGIIDQIPKGAVLILLPEDDKELHDENYKMLDENRKQGNPAFVVSMKIPKLQITNMEVIAS